MRLKVAYSPCPNDTFAFHAMVHHLIDTEGLTFEVHLADIEQLNGSAANEEFDICKLSYNAYFHLCDKYIMLRSGSALGFNNGPLLVHMREDIPSESTLKNYKIAIPGINTTAALLLKIAYPQCKNLTPVVFSDIEARVISGEFDAGLLIHEGRFTYQEKGLKLLKDLGSFWQEYKGLPIPLGGIAIHRKHTEISHKVNRILKKSIEFAFSNPSISKQYIKAHAQELDDRVQHEHIKLYVNDYSLDIGKEGENAVKVLYDAAFCVDNQIKEATNLFIL